MGPLVSGAIGAGAGAGLGGLLGQVGDTLSYPRRELWKALGLPEYGHQVLEQYAGMDPESYLTKGLGMGLDIAGDPLTYAGMIGGGLGGAAAPGIMAGAEGVAEAAPAAVGAFLADESGAANLTKLGELLGVTEREYAPAFYSRLNQAAETLPAKTDAVSALNKIKGAGVKGEEIQYTGLPDMLGARKGITRDEILQHLDENAIELGRKDYQAGDTAYQFKSLPGGTDYRETLLTLPENRMAASPFQSQHWKDDPNVLAHLRSQTRLTPEGQPVHAIEEIQSDWHQRGRDYGYAAPGVDLGIVGDKLDDSEELVGKLMNERELLKTLPSLETDPETLADLMSYPTDRVNYNLTSLLRGNRGALTRLEGMFGPDTLDRIRELANLHGPFGQRLEGILPQLDAANAESSALSNMLEAVPPAPFKDTWHELALKQAIRDAAEGGHDYVAWAPGEAQAQIQGFAGGGGGGAADGTDGLLDEFLDMPEFADNTVPGPAARSDKMANGMRQFYDQRLPGFANKYVKKWSTQVGPVDVGLDQPWHGFPITPQMREDVLYKGQPLLTPLLALLGGAGAAGAGGYAMSQGG